MKTKIIAGLLVILPVISLSGCTNSSNADANMFGGDEVLKGTVENTLANLESCDKANTLYVQALSFFDDYIDEKIDSAQLTAKAEEIKAALSECRGVIADDTLKENALADERFDGELSMGEYIDSVITGLAENTDYLCGYLQIPAVLNNKNYYHEFVDIYRSESKNNFEIIWLESNNYFSGINNDSIVNYIKEKASELSLYANMTDSWSTDKDKIAKLEELRFAQLDTLYQKREIMLGDATMDLENVKKLMGNSN